MITTNVTAPKTNAIVYSAYGRSWQNGCKTYWRDYDSVVARNDGKYFEVGVQNGGNYTREITKEFFEKRLEMLKNSHNKISKFRENIILQYTETNIYFSY